MGILLQYNKDISYTFEELSQSTDLSADVLSGQLGILVKAKVLLLSSGSAVGEPSSRYDLNTEFKRFAITIINPFDKYYMLMKINNCYII